MIPFCSQNHPLSFGPRPLPAASCPRVCPRFCCEHLPRGASDPRGGLRSAALTAGLLPHPQPRALQGSGRHRRAGVTFQLLSTHRPSSLPGGGGRDPRLALQRRQSSVSVSHSRYKSVRTAAEARGCSGRWRQSCKPNTQETLQPGSSRSSG